MRGETAAAAMSRDLNGRDKRTRINNDSRNANNIIYRRRRIPAISSAEAPGTCIIILRVYFIRY